MNPGHTPRRRRWLVTTALTGAAAVLAVAPAAASACTPSTTPGTRAFAPFGDTSSYVLAPGGSFEAGTSGWTLSDAAVVSGNETYHLNSAKDTHSLQIQPGGSAISAPICVSSSQPTFRFMAAQSSGSWDEMNVYVLWTNSAGKAQTTGAGSVQPTSSWSPSPVFDLGEMLPTEGGQTYSVRLQFVPAAGGGAVSIDDLFVDPYTRT